MYPLAIVNLTIKYINIGVPQGSVLGPFLFLIYINDISNITDDVGKNKYNLMMFADDTNIFMSNKNLHLLKEDAESIMNKLCAWFKCNRLTLSIEKTNYSIFHRHRTKIPSFLDNLKFEQHSIQRLTTVKYLGLYLDDKLTWTDHTTQTSKKLTKIISFVKIIKHYVPEKCKEQLIVSCVMDSPQQCVIGDYIIAREL